MAVTSRNHTCRCMSDYGPLLGSDLTNSEVLISTSAEIVGYRNCLKKSKT